MALGYNVRQMADAVTSRLRALLKSVESVCDCPRCDVDAYRRALGEHLAAHGPGYRPEHMRAAWEKPTPRRSGEPETDR